MNTPSRIYMTFVFVLSAVGVCPICSAQDAAMTGASAGYAKTQPVNVTSIQPISSDIVLTVPVAGAAQNSGSANSGAASPAAAVNAHNISTDGNIPGLQTVPTFSGAFAAQGGPSLGTVFPFVMIGNDPLIGGTTEVPGRITEVSLRLLNADGTTFANVPFAPFENLTQGSPVFANSPYTSVNQPTQFADAVQRAEFFRTMKSNWHTLLQPSLVVNRVTIAVPRFVNVRFPDGTIHSARSYFTGTAVDGSTFVLMLDLLFNFFYENAVVSDINAGNFTTDSVNMDVFPNTYLFSLNKNNPSVPGTCCVLGFHTYFFDPSAAPEPRWITAFASFMSPGLFGGGFQDVTALSHEVTETFNDPFGDNPTPSWQFPNQPATSKVCQGNLETGDPVDVLGTATIPVTLRDHRQVFTFHPQTEALLQWFEMGAMSDAIDGAFSYPDEKALTKSAVPCPQ